MRIRGRHNNRIVITTMVQGSDLPEALISIKTIQEASAGLPHLVLWNDEPDPSKTESLVSLGGRVLTAGSNLGVAAGRNLLLSAAMDLGAEWVVQLDDDLLVPRDYLKRAIRLVRRIERDDQHLGMLSPVVLGFQSLAEHSGIGTGIGEWGPVLISTTRLRRLVESTYGDRIPTSAIDYMGISGWERHYLSAHGSASRMARGFLIGSGTGALSVDGNLRSDPMVRDEILKQGLPIRADTVPGGVAIVSARMVEDVGLLDESMGRFGYEDAELCIRARRQGYGIYLAPSLLLVHDIQRRGRTRGLDAVYRGRNRHRALLLDRHAPREHLGNWIFELFVLGITEAVDAIVRKSGAADSDKASRLYLGSVAEFVHQWHKLNTGNADDGGQASSSGTGGWAVRQTRDRDELTTTAQFNGTEESRLSDVSVRLVSVGSGPEPSSLGWVIQATTLAGSEMFFDVEMERGSNIDGSDWRVSAVHGRWQLKPEEIEAWGKYVRNSDYDGWFADTRGARRDTSPIEGQIDLKYRPARPVADVSLGHLE